MPGPTMRGARSRAPSRAYTRIHPSSLSTSTSPDRNARRCFMSTAVETSRFGPSVHCSRCNGRGVSEPSRIAGRGIDQPPSRRRPIVGDRCPAARRCASREPSRVQATRQPSAIGSAMPPLHAVSVDRRESRRRTAARRRTRRPSRSSETRSFGRADSMSPTLPGQAMPLAAAGSSRSRPVVVVYARAYATRLQSGDGATSQTLSRCTGSAPSTREHEPVRHGIVFDAARILDDEQRSSIVAQRPAHSRRHAVGPAVHTHDGDGDSAVPAGTRDQRTPARSPLAKRFRRRAARARCHPGRARYRPVAVSAVARRGQLALPPFSPSESASAAAAAESAPSPRESACPGDQVDGGRSGGVVRRSRSVAARDTRRRQAAASATRAAAPEPDESSPARAA